MKTIEITDMRDWHGMNPSVSLKSLDTSSVTFRISKTTAREEDRIIPKEIVRVTLKGKTILVGPVAPIQQIESPGGHYDQVTVNDYWEWINTTPAGTWSPNWSGVTNPPSLPPNSDYRYFPNPPSSYQVARYEDRIDPKDGNTKAQIGTVLARTVGSAVGGFMNYEINISNDAELIPFRRSGQMWGDIIRSIMRWRPNAVSTIDYTEIDNAYKSRDEEAIIQAKPKIIFLEPKDMGFYEISKNTHDRKPCQLTPRHDLVPPVVAIIIATQSYLGKSVWTVFSKPPFAELSQPGAVIAEFSESVTGASASLVSSDDEDEEEEEQRRFNQKTDWRIQTMEVRGKRIPQTTADAIEFYKRHVPELEDVNFEVVNLLRNPAPTTGAEGAGYSAQAIGYELVEGAIGNKTPGLKWCDTIVSCRIVYRGVPPASLKRYFPNILQNQQGYWGYLGVQLITMNVRRARWTVGGDYDMEDLSDQEDPDDDEEDPPDAMSPALKNAYKPIVDAYYDDLQLLPYEGNVVFSSLDNAPQIGQRLRILDGRPDWATMEGAIIQTVSLDIESEDTTITVGPPNHLSIQDNIDKISKFDSLNEETKDTGEEDPNTGTGGASWDAQFPDRKKPEAPGITPRSTILLGGYGDYKDGDFAVRPVLDLFNEVVGYEVKQGTISDMTRVDNSKTCGDQQWTFFGPFTEAIYCNFDVDMYGIIQEPIFSSSPGINNPYIVKANTGPQEPGSYSFEIATMIGSQVNQTQYSPIFLTYGIDTFMIPGPE